MVLKVILYLFGLFAGTYFSLFILTYFEAGSQKFQNASGRIHNAVRGFVWIILVIVSYAFFSYYFLTQTEITYIRASIFTGLITGVIVYFKAGPNIDRAEMERESEAPKEKFSPKSILNFFRGPVSDKKKKAAGSARRAGSSKSADSKSSKSKSSSGKSAGKSSETRRRPPKRLN